MSKKVILFEAHLPVHLDFIKPIYDFLDAKGTFQLDLSIFDEEYEAVREYLDSLKMEPENVIRTSEASSYECDMFLSATTWTEFIPPGDIPKVQILHGLADKNEAFGGRMDLFNILFLTGPNHKRVFQRVRSNDRKMAAIKTYDVGYPKLDSLISGDVDIQKLRTAMSLEDKKTVIYAPTWELTASLHSCGIELIESLASLDINLLVKLHPMSYRGPQYTFATGGIDWRKELGELEKRYPNMRNVLDSDSGPYLALSDLMVTDVSGVGLEFLTLDKPLVFMDAPQFFEERGRGGIEERYRQAGEIAESVPKALSLVKKELKDPERKSPKRKMFLEELLFNQGKAAAVAARKIEEILEDGERKEVPASKRTPGLTSIIVPAFGSGSGLSDCLDSIAEHTSGDYEVIVVDDGSSEDLSGLAGGKAKVVSLPFHRGVQASRNRGAIEAKGDLLLFMDSDVTVGEGWLEGLKAGMKENKAQLAGPLSNFSRPEQMQLRDGQKSKKETAPTDFLDAFCLAAKREVIDKIGGFDTDLEGEWAAEDFCARAKLAGFKAVIVGEVIVAHRGSKTLAALGDMVEMSHRAWVKLTAKWGIKRTRSMLDGFDLAAASYDNFEPYLFCSLKKERPKLSFNIIAKNEEAELARCLDSVKGIADEIVMVDTGSTDATVKIAKRFGAKVLDQPWENDFSKPRNLALSNSTGGWVMFLDADEELSPEDKSQIRALLYEKEAECWFFTLQNFVGDEKGHDAVLNSAMRLWRNRPHYRFAGALHEQIFNVIAERGTYKLSKIRLNHYGYMNKPVLEKGKQERNLRIASELVASRPNDSFALFNLGVEYFRGKDYDKALESFRDSFFNLPNLSVQYAHMLVYNMAMTLKELQRPEEALEVINEAKDAYPDFRDLYFLEAIIHSESKDYAVALESLDKCMDITNDNPEYVRQRSLEGERSLISKGRILEMMGDVRQAVKEYTAAINKNPQFLEAIARMGSLMLARDEDPEQVREFLERVSDTEDWRVLETLYDVFAASKRHGIAWSFLEKALELNPSLPQAEIKKANAVLHMRDYQQAEMLYRSILSNTPEHQPAASGLLFSLVLQGRASEALKLMDEKSSVIPGATQELYRLLLGKKGELLMTPENRVSLIGAFWGLLEKLMELEEYELFEKMMRHRYNLDEEEGLSDLRAGKLFFGGGFIELASEHLMKAAESGKCDAEGWTMLSRYAERSQQKEVAVDFLKQAINMDPSNLGNYTKLASLLSSLGMKEECHQVLKAASERFPHTESLKRAMELAGIMAS